MTDKELAEEYIKDNCIRWECDSLSVDDIAKENFLAGLKLGRLMKWHKVADGDLPRQEGNTCFSIDVLADGRRWVYYNFMNGKWFCGNKETKVTAWIEIPKETV